MLLINMLLAEVDRHEEKESQTKITGHQRHKDKQHKHTSHSVRNSFPLEAAREGTCQLSSEF